MARNQRGRLQGAMVEAVARHGFTDTTLRELVSLAGVSKSTFYEHFENKQDCFLSTFDYIGLEVERRVDDAFDRPGDLREKITAGITTAFTVIAEEQAAASLVTVESLTLGAAAVPHRERASAALRRADPAGLRRIPVATPGHGADREGNRRRHPQHRLPPPPRGPRRGASGGGRADRRVDPLLRPAAGRDGAERGAGRRPARRSGRRRPPSRDPDSLDKRERIVCAATELAFERGYEALSIPAIAAAAGVSNQTFYDHFPGKQEAFLAGFDGSHRRRWRWSRQRRRPRSRGRRPSAPGCGPCSSRPPRMSPSRAWRSSSCRWRARRRSTRRTAPSAASPPSSARRRCPRTPRRRR